MPPVVQGKKKWKTKIENSAHALYDYIISEPDPSRARHHRLECQPGVLEPFHPTLVVFNVLTQTTDGSEHPPAATSVWASVDVHLVNETLHMLIERFKSDKLAIA